MKARVASSRGLWGSINQRDWLRVEEINRARLDQLAHGRDDLPM